MYAGTGRSSVAAFERFRLIEQDRGELRGRETWIHPHHLGGGADFVGCQRIERVGDDERR